MAFWAIGDRGVCAALMMIAAVLLALRLQPRGARAAWLVLLAAGITNALYLNLLPHNVINGNLVHYYLGAKYAVPYQNFYRAIHAGLEDPQVDMRDLGQPDRFLRSLANEQRAYYIDLLRQDGAEFDPLGSLSQLRRRAEEAGILGWISQSILSENVPVSQLDAFRRDLRLAVPEIDGRSITYDFGFNGSPFYAFVRHLDPTLYRPIGRMTAWLNLAWQILAILVLAWVTGMALGVDVNGRLAMAALVFASWDVIGYALLGLIFAGLWFPIAVALYAHHRGAVRSAGVAIAWAGLIKLFPFVLLLPASARLARTGLRRVRSQRETTLSSQWLQLLAGCAAASATLAVLATFSGRSWADFFHKIVLQFGSKGATANNVSLVKGLHALGIDVPSLPAILSLLSLAVLTAMFLRGKDTAVMSTLPRRSLVLLAAAGWVAPNWLNYYSVAALLLLPLLARRHRVGAPVAAMAMALAFVLPEFGAALGAVSPAFKILKLAPYILVPAWLVYLEFLGLGMSRRAHRTLTATCTVCILAIAGGAWRMHAIRTWTHSAAEYVDRGDAQGALERYERVARLSPRNIEAYTGMAVAHVNLGDMPGARSDFERVIRLSPDNARARQNYGRFLLDGERPEEAAREFEAARRILPFDEYILFDLARARLKLGQRRRAESLLIRAQELDPANKGVSALLATVQNGSPEAEVEH